MFSLFALPKAFTGDMAVVQRNAVASWTRLRPTPEIILLGDDAGVAEAAREFGVRHVPAIARNAHGTPLASDVFERGQRVAAHDTLCYVNADIILFDDLPAAVSCALQWRPEFLLTGGRLDLAVHEELRFEPGWDQRLRAKAHSEGQPKGGWWLDYFVFRRGFAPTMPPFAIGRGCWDNWIVDEARRSGLPIVDASRAVTIVHQSHDYAHIPGRRGDLWWGVESDHNAALAAGRSSSLQDATHFLARGRILRRYPLRTLRRVASRVKHLCLATVSRRKV